MTEDKMVEWHHQLNGHEFEQVPEDSEGQGSLACCSPQDHRESDMTEQLNSHSEPSVNCFFRRCVSLGWLHVSACSRGTSGLCVSSPYTL